MIEERIAVAYVGLLPSSNSIVTLAVVLIPYKLHYVICDDS